MTKEYDSRTYPTTPITPPSPTVEGDDETQTAAPTFDEIRGRHYRVYKKLDTVVENETSRILLELLYDYDGSGVSYDMVLDYVDVSRRYVREQVYGLRDAGIVEVTDTGIALVGLTEDVYLSLVSDVLNNYYEI